MTTKIFHNLNYMTRYNLVLIGMGLGALFWVLEATAHVVVFRDVGIFQQIYSPEPHEVWMRLIVISPLPLEQLTDLVVKDFKEVPNLKRPQENLSAPLFLPEPPSYVYIEPIKNVRKLTLIWDLPPKFSHMKDSKPDSIICYVLGHEGKGSLLADLKEEKLAEAITCGSIQYGPNNSWMTCSSITQTFC